MKLYDRLVVIISALANKGNSRLITIAYRAVFALGQFGQQLAEIVGVRLLRAVDYVQRTGGDICGRGGLGDGEPVRIIGRDIANDRFGIFRRAFKHIVVACKRHSEGKRFSVADLGRIRIAPICLLHGEAGVRDAVSTRGEAEI